MPTYSSHEASSQGDRALAIVNNIEETFLYLFSSEEQPFVATNQFVSDLVQEHAKALRIAVMTGGEEAIFQHWKQRREQYRRAMIGNQTLPIYVEGKMQMHSVVTEAQLIKLKELCPEPGEYNVRSEDLPA